MCILFLPTFQFPNLILIDNYLSSQLFKHVLNFFNTMCIILYANYQYLSTTSLPCICVSPHRLEVGCESYNRQGFHTHVLGIKGQILKSLMRDDNLVALLLL